jgi:hypothetical protein
LARRRDFVLSLKLLWISWAQRNRTKYRTSELSCRTGTNYRTQTALAVMAIARRIICELRTIESQHHQIAASRISASSSGVSTIGFGFMLLAREPFCTNAGISAPVMPWKPSFGI